MKQNKEVVCVPQIGVNDASVIVVEYLFNEGDHVTQDELLVIIESTKVSVDIVAESSGYFLPCCAVGAEVKINGHLGYLFDSLESLEEFKQALQKNEVPKQKTEKSSVNATKKAQILIEKYSLNINEIKTENAIIRESDVLKHLPSAHIDMSEFDWGRIPVVIYGCGNGALTVKETIYCDKYQVVGFIVDRENYKNEIEALPVLLPARLEDLRQQNISHIALAVTNSVVRLLIFNQREEEGFTIINAIHNKAYISPTAKIGAGNHIKAGAIIDTNSIIGNACIIDNNVTIPHDNVIEDGVHLAPGVTLGSSITIGRNSIIGIGASISTDIIVGDYSIISVGTSVIKNVPARSIVEGVPGKIIGTRK